MRESDIAVYLPIKAHTLSRYCLSRSLAFARYNSVNEIEYAYTTMDKEKLEPRVCVWVCVSMKAMGIQRKRGNSENKSR